MLEIVLPCMYGLHPQDVARFARDKSGVAKAPAPGSEGTPPTERLWLQLHQLHYDFLGRHYYLNAINEAFLRSFRQTIEKKPLTGTWESASIIDICRRDVTKSAIAALIGDSLFEIHPDFLDTFWAYDSHIFKFSLGLPRWMIKESYQTRDRFWGMLNDYLDSAEKQFDWDGPDAEAAWEPLFGARVSREFLKWGKDRKFISSSPAARFLGLLLFA